MTTVQRRSPKKRPHQETAKLLRWPKEDLRTPTEKPPPSGPSPPSCLTAPCQAEPPSRLAREPRVVESAQTGRHVGQPCLQTDTELRHGHPRVSVAP